MHDVFSGAVPKRFKPAQGAGNFLPPLPPFHRPYAVNVEAGMLVLFPSWLVHAVEDNMAISTNDGYRISFAFNLAGDWHDTSGLVVDLDAPSLPGSPTTTDEQSARVAPQDEL